MSIFDEVHSSRLGWPTPGPIQRGDHGRLRVGIHLGDAHLDRPDRRTLWFEDRQELLALLNATSRQLERWDATLRQDAVQTHPSQQPAAAAAGDVRGPFEPPMSAMAVPNSMLSAAPAAPGGEGGAVRVAPYVTAAASGGQVAADPPHPEAGP